MHGAQHDRSGEKNIVVGQTQRHITLQQRCNSTPDFSMALDDKNEGTEFNMTKQGLERESSGKSNKIIKGLEGFTYEED